MICSKEWDICESEVQVSPRGSFISQHWHIPVRLEKAERRQGRDGHRTAFVLIDAVLYHHLVQRVAAVLCELSRLLRLNR